ncbi:MAG: hypothetical protein GY909_06420 [Oligoflexia bacterium]|nr:hypothetical protein [Oligoflexia bacterium]
METSIEEKYIDDLDFIRNLKFCHPEGGVFDYFVNGVEPNAIYPEISGYYLTLISYLKMLGLNLEEEIITHCERTISFLEKHISEDGLPSKVFLNNTSSKKYYFFDVSMVGLGLVNYYQVFNNRKALDLALEIENIVHNKFFDERGNFKPHLNCDDKVSTWSQVFGPYHLKCSIFLHKVSQYSSRCWNQTIERQLDYILEKNVINNIVYNQPEVLGYHSHPMCYFLEGLLYFNLKTNLICKDRFKSIMNRFFKLEQPLRYRSNTGENKTIRNDVVAQVLRLHNICDSYPEIETFNSETFNTMNKIIEEARIGGQGYSFGQFSCGEISQDINSWVSFMALQNKHSDSNADLAIEFIV